jgi:hypothetical protein
MGLAMTREMDGLERWMTFLASTGSVAPFVGLFGTVWGHHEPFSGIAAHEHTNLAVVAPGIAEALFATAIGLVAAIPAVLAYNKLSTDLARFAGRLEAFAGEFGAILSRQADDASTPRAARDGAGLTVAASFTPSGPGGGRRGRYRPMAEINVTPLVDVMLVLLIIFMVAAPLMTSGVAVDLPRTNAAALNQEQSR